MRLLCSCGQTMILSFRMVIFEDVYQIDLVPILECENCASFELVPSIKQDVTKLLAELKQEHREGRVVFTHVNELAAVLYDIYESGQGEVELSSFEAVVIEKCEERINLLLDLYGYAKKTGDCDWMEEISFRLSGLSSFVKTRQFLET
ncbi:hypothetical protein GCM10010913_05920 [Paenibacillus aceti]|uniref:YgiT-type zinc finger domain-containing protein n=3 Tax=Paenibacillus aceti TaxID=1820010 RepID=A0ABQ1VPR9_9BACL|nr:hypothetical protein GCM10010913_05920 [Paenibacillus aceti]